MRCYLFIPRIEFLGLLWHTPVCLRVLFRVPGVIMIFRIWNSKLSYFCLEVWSQIIKTHWPPVLKMPPWGGSHRKFSSQNHPEIASHEITALKNVDTYASVTIGMRQIYRQFAIKLAWSLRIYVGFPCNVLHCPCIKRSSQSLAESN